MNLRVREVNFADAHDARAIVTIIDSYAADPAGGSRALTRDARERLVPSLRDHPSTLIFLALVDDEPVGIAVCFFGLSTFRARPLLNIHDLAVLPQYRGKGIGRALLREVEDHARRKGCCKLTLEVQENNRPARVLYQRFGFSDFVVDNLGATRFLEKPLED